MRFKIYHRLLDSKTRTTTRTINTKYRLSLQPLVSRCVRGTPGGGGGGGGGGGEVTGRIKTPKAGD